MDIYRMATRGNAETDFSMIAEGQQFPTNGISQKCLLEVLQQIVQWYIC